jgi:hypothetical protein
MASSLGQKRARHLTARSVSCRQPLLRKLLSSGQPRTRASTPLFLEGEVRYLRAGVEVQPLELRAVAAKGGARRVRDFLALAQVQLLDVWTGLGQRPHRQVADALAAAK